MLETLIQMILGKVSNTTQSHQIFQEMYNNHVNMQAVSHKSCQNGAARAKVGVVGKPHPFGIVRLKTLTPYQKRHYYHNFFLRLQRCNSNNTNPVYIYVFIAYKMYITIWPLHCSTGEALVSICGVTAPQGCQLKGYLFDQVTLDRLLSGRVF